MIRLLLLTLLAPLSLEVTAQRTDSAVVHTLFLVGDAGEPHVKDTPLGKALREKISRAGKHSTVLFLGDNVYPAGLPEKDARSYALAELSLQTQVSFLAGLNTRGIFVPGNHDWQHWGRKGLQYIRNQQQWLDSLKQENISLLPRSGCPGPVQVPLDDGTLLLILDTQWFLHQWEKPGNAELCEATTTAEVLTVVEDIFRNNRGKRIIVAAHHPLVTYGEHGGVFTWKAHIFPLEEITQYLYIPLPVIGSIYPLYRKWFGHIQDTAHPVYKEFAEALQRLMADHPGSMYVAGHEHALQYIFKDSTHMIVSGAAAKTEYVKKKEHAVFAEDILGFAQLSLLANGAVTIRFFQVDDQYPSSREVFVRSVPPINEIRTDAGLLPTHYQEERVRVKASDQYEAGNVKKFLLGANYRSAWSQEISVPLFDLGDEKGGLRILQKGGGQQTLSLRLADSSGREFVLRSVEKFPGRAIPEVLRETFAQDLVQDQISASHPYAALVVPRMAEAVGLYHTNPRLVYIPDDPRFGEYRETFANTLALFEERPDEDWSDAPYFGNSKNIISTSKLIEKLAEDSDNSVDQEFVLRNRLFDLIIGDWDRHDDQWRWATIKDKKSNLYRPIPRDRDQTFFVNEGALAKIWSRRWALPKFEGFDEDIDWPAGLSFNARHFDRSFLTQLSREAWIEIAGDLKNDFTDDVIESSLRQWPEEVFDLHGEEIIRKLKTRRDNIVAEAISYYEFLAREVDVTGSDKRELFVIERLQDGDVHLKIYKHGGDRGGGKQIYDRRFRKSETREVRVYGLKGGDEFQISGASDNSILLRIIGGEGDDFLSDSSKVRGPARKTFFYDVLGEGAFTSAGEVRDLRAASPSVNEYDRASFEYDRLAPLLYGNYNFDDGIFVGGGFLLHKNGFRKEPYSERHLFLASVAPNTGSYNFLYHAKFIALIAKWNFELKADVKAPNFVNNFFGMGNESVFDRDVDEQPAIGVEHAIQYYRYRFEDVSLFASLSRSLGSWGNLNFGPMVQRVRMEKPREGQNRYIAEYAKTLSTDLFSGSSAFAGIAWDLEAGERGDDIADQRGSRIRLSGRHMAGLGGTPYDFSSLDGSFSFYHSFRERSRLVVAGRVGAGINQGSYPFYQAQILDGKSALRGFRETRFYGDSKLFANLEVRVRLLSFRSYLFPASFGILGFHDVGRIWYKNESGEDPSTPQGRSATWHQGWGGGVWFTPFNLTVLSIEAGHSREGTLASLRMGFLF